MYDNLVIGILGDKGAGKTTLLTLLALVTHNETSRVIYSNYKLNFEFKYLDIYDLILNKVKFKNASIFIDELHEYADSRYSASKQNRLISSFFLQSRHYLADVIYTTQYLNQIDLRIRNITDFYFTTERLNKDYDIYLLNLYDKTLRIMNREYFNFKDIYKYFDTTERINPFLIDKRKIKELEDYIINDYEEKVNKYKKLEDFR